MLIRLVSECRCQVPGAQAHQRPEAPLPHGRGGCTGFPLHCRSRLRTGGGLRQSHVYCDFDDACDDNEDEEDEDEDEDDDDDDDDDDDVSGVLCQTGLLSRLEELGLKLSDLEKLLPLGKESALSLIVDSTPAQ
jgi:hypothetical protein